MFNLHDLGEIEHIKLLSSPYPQVLKVAFNLKRLFITQHLPEHNVSC